MNKKEVLSILKEMREVSAACFRVISTNSDMVGALGKELSSLGINNGFGIRCQNLIKKLEKEAEKNVAIRYSVGIDDGQNGVGMTHGPFIQLSMTLAITPSDSKSGIYELPSGKLLFRWNNESLDWESINEEE